MAKEANDLTPPPVLSYARLLIEMHRLINEGMGDSEQAEALTDRMDAPWFALGAREQLRMRGLATDLHKLREGGPKRVNMTPEEFAAWQRGARDAFSLSEAGDPDAVLTFLRKPAPSMLPGHVVPFLQSRSWHKLGDLETALLFMKEAERLDPEQALSVLVLLQHLERVDELPAYADRVIRNPASTPLELYLAAVALLFPTRRMADTEAAPFLRQVVSVLKRALAEFMAQPHSERAKAPDTDVYIGQALGLCLARLGDLQAAINVYDQALASHPREAELLMARGLALYESDLPRALADLRKAAQCGIGAIWPYLLLARHSLHNGLPAEALRLALTAEGQPGPASVRAEVYETIAMSLASLGQAQERVLSNFDTALALDPLNDRIRQNRDLAAAPASALTGRMKPPRLHQAPPIKLDALRQALGEHIDRRSDLLNEQHRARASDSLVLV